MKRADPGRRYLRAEAHTRMLVAMFAEQLEEDPGMRGRLLEFLVRNGRMPEPGES